MDQGHSQNTVVAPALSSICRWAIMELHKAGKISCIRFVREITYLGLKEAKAYVEQVMIDEGLVFPQDTWKSTDAMDTVRNQLNDVRNQLDNARGELASVKNQLRNIIEG